MIRRPPRSTHIATLVPDSTRFRCPRYEMAPRRKRLGRPAVIAELPVCFLASGRWQGGRHVASPLFTCSCPARFAATPKAPRSPWFHPTADPGGGREIGRAHV